MKIEFTNFKDNAVNLMRSLGYAFDKRLINGEMSFTKKISGQDFPRFHAYIKQEKNNLIVSLHLDQKRPSYEVGSAHGGEYEGELITNEINRIKGIN